MSRPTIRTQNWKFVCLGLLRLFYDVGFVAVLLAVSLCGAVAANGQNMLPLAGAASSIAPEISAVSPSCKIIYLGFVGALEPPDNKYSGVVQIRDVLRGSGFGDVCASSYSPYVWTMGRDWLLKHFPAHEGALTPAELLLCPKVILVGHSMGGWAMMSVARELRSRNIPVELTIQVDSVGITDQTVPRNVKNGALFHAHDVLMFMTTRHLKMEDPRMTKLVANVIVTGAGHESITRDPRIRELVISTIERLRAGLLAPATAELPIPLEAGPAKAE
jgi:hypothetical protein